MHLHTSIYRKGTKILISLCEVQILLGRILQYYENIADCELVKIEYERHLVQRAMAEVTQPHSGLNNKQTDLISLRAIRALSKSVQSGHQHHQQHSC